MSKINFFLGTAMILGGCAALLFSGCTVSSQSLSANKNRPYDYESSILHPRAVLVYDGLDSVQVYLEVKRLECLYLRESPQSPFISSLIWHIGDTAFQVNDTLTSFAEPWDKHSIRIALKDLNKADSYAVSANVMLEDLLRNTRKEWSVPIAETSFQRTAFDPKGWPYSQAHAVVGDTVFFRAKAGTTWHHASIPVPPSMPAPPFSFSKDRSDTLQPILRSSIRADELGNAFYIIDKGINVILDATDPRSIVQLMHGTELPFDQVRDLRLMIQSSRYITSRSEFEKMAASSDPKAALDVFWLSCANEKDQGAQLISTYYGRVEEANRYFSGILPGWKTDRGMVHIVFGVPNKIRKSRESEWWIYGDEDSVNSVTFRFLKVEHPWDDNFYALGRNIQFRMPWDRMVTNWRNGRVTPD